MKTRLLYLSDNEESIVKFRSLKLDCLLFEALDQKKAIKFLKSRFPSIIIFSETLLNSWGVEVLDYINKYCNHVDLVIEFKSMTKGTMINLINNFNVSKVIQINARDYHSIIESLIAQNKSDSQKNKDRKIFELENRVKQFQYILQQGLIES